MKRANTLQNKTLLIGGPARPPFYTKNPNIIYTSMNTIGNYNLTHTIYRFLPVTHVKSLERFLEQGIHPGDFMACVLENNLKGAIANADENSKQHLCDLVMFIHNHLPGRFLKPGCVNEFINGTVRYTVTEGGYCDWVETDPIKVKYISEGA